MYTANTLQARSLVRVLTNNFRVHTYTDKTTRSNSPRRSVVFTMQSVEDAKYVAYKLSKVITNEVTVTGANEYMNKIQGTVYLRIKANLE